MQPTVKRANIHTALIFPQNIILLLIMFWSSPVLADDRYGREPLSGDVDLFGTLLMFAAVCAVAYFDQHSKEPLDFFIMIPFLILSMGAAIVTHNVYAGVVIGTFLTILLTLFLSHFRN